MANPDKFIRLRDFAKIMRALRETDVDGTTFHYDESKHEYANVKEFYSQHRSGRIYGVQFPATPSPMCPQARRPTTTQTCP